MHHFCTLFDSNYLSRGLAMYYSLRRNCEAFHLYIFAFDTIAYNILISENLPCVTVIPLADFEDEDLLKIKKARSIAEYCWTCTSSTILYILDTYKVPMCTYIDADLFFYASPQPLFDELGARSILLTEHRFSPQYRSDLIKGRFCVQFISFRNDERGRVALHWWRRSCLKWCYAKLEDGKFGDQGYLNDWETRFEGVHVMQNLGGGIAPWNIQQYPIFAENGKLYGTHAQQDFELIFYHFHYLKFFTNGTLELGRRELTPNDLSLIYVPYIQELLRIGKDISKKYGIPDAHGIKDNRFLWKTPLIYVYRKIKGVYHIYNTNDFVQTFGAVSNPHSLKKEEKND